MEIKVVVTEKDSLREYPNEFDDFTIEGYFVKDGWFVMEAKYSTGETGRVLIPNKVKNIRTYEIWND